MMKRKRMTIIISIIVLSFGIMLYPSKKVYANNNYSEITVTEGEGESGGSSGGGGEAAISDYTIEPELYFIKNSETVDYTILIPLSIQVTGTRSTDKFQIRIDTSSAFNIETNASVHVTVDNTTANLVNGEDTIAYTLTDSSSGTAAIANNPLVSFTTIADPPKDVYVYFNPDEGDAAGRYSDVMVFTVSYHAP
jgi:hypothetical protein